MRKVIIFRFFNNKELANEFFCDYSFLSEREPIVTNQNDPWTFDTVTDIGLHISEDDLQMIISNEFYIFNKVGKQHYVVKRKEDSDERGGETEDQCNGEKTKHS